LANNNCFNNVFSPLISLFYLYAHSAIIEEMRKLLQQLIFDSNCSGCHAHGGNAILPNYPLRSAPELGKFEDFRQFIRNPRLPSGAEGPMPAFPPSRISETQAHQLYEYITHVVEKPSRQPTG
jgi:mono/diheme cytochrome c family protein